MSYTFKTKINKQEHDHFVMQHVHCNLLQSSKWADIKENWQNEIVGLYEGDVLIASASILIKSLPAGFTMFYIPKGPILDYSNFNVLNAFFKHLKKFARSYKCLFIKLDPPVIYRDFTSLTDSANPPEQNALDALQNLKKLGCIHLGFSKEMHDTIQPRFHATVKNSKDYLENLPKHTKRHIKTARKKHIHVNICGIECVSEFSRLSKLTEERKSINLRSENYFEKLMRTYGDDAKLFLAQINIPEILSDSINRVDILAQKIEKCSPNDQAKKDGFIREMNALQKDINHLIQWKKEDGECPMIAGALCIYFGNTCEMLYMAMDGKYQRFHGAYLSHIEPIQYAFEHGYTYCNMGGIENNLQGGLTKFKSNFSPNYIEYAGEFNIPINKLLYKPANYFYEKRKQKS